MCKTMQPWLNATAGSHCSTRRSGGLSTCLGGWHGGLGFRGWGFMTGGGLGDGDGGPKGDAGWPDGGLRDD